MRRAPNQMTATLEPLITSITIGNMRAMSRPADSDVSVRSSLTRSKRAASCGSRTKARTTRMPVICSRRTRLTPSIRSCIRRNRGTIPATTRPRPIPRTGRLTARSQDSPASCRSAMSTPPTTVIGAAMAIVQVMATSSWTCCTSLVMRVMSDGAPKVPTSWAEKAVTRWKSALRTSRPKPMAAREPTYTAPIEKPTCTSVTRSISPPMRQMVAVSPVMTPSSMMSAFRVGR
jgi:hypothetical protein